jgi:hypothetical protein
MEADIDTFVHYHSWNEVERPTKRKILDSKRDVKLKHLVNGSVDKFKARLFETGLYQIQ